MTTWTRRELIERATIAVALLACAAFPVALLAVRARYVGELTYSFLLWNLFLAGLPVLFAVAAEGAWRNGRPVLTAVSMGLWLLFFPNAPYLVTDLVHLRPRPPTPVWFDALILVSAGVAGLLAGFASLRLVHLAVRRRVGPIWAWVGAAVVLSASGFGVYLGRFARFNSWDVLARPRELLYDVTVRDGEPLSGRRTIAVTMLFSAFLIVTYVAVVAIATLRTAGGDEVSSPPD